jgi:RecA-family ATPase
MEIENPIEIIRRNASQATSEKADIRLKREVTGTELLSLGIQDIPKLLDPIFPKIGLAALGGSSDTGKSSLLRYLAVSICTGADTFLGWKLNPTFRSAIYVATEDGHDAISFLLSRLCNAMKIGPKEIEKLRFIFFHDNIIEHLNESLTRMPSDLVVIDAFTDLYGGNLNEANAVRNYLHDFAELSVRHQCLVLFLHHTSKGKDGYPPSKHHLIGSQAFEAKMRLVVELRMDPTHSSIRHFCIVKGNYLPVEFKQESFELEFYPDFTFESTGNRKDFELLVKKKTEDSRREKFEMATRLKLEGKTYDEIASTLGYKSKSSVADLFKEFE